MKKILTLALVLGVAWMAGAQKTAVDAASKAAKSGNMAEARTLIQQAVTNPETAKDVRTYFTASKMEFDAYDKARTKQMINPQDESIDPMAMAEQVVNGYQWGLKALPFDSIPNEKGQVKPKHTKDIIKNINGHFQDYFNAGGTFYNSKKYYPEAYTAFMIYGDLPVSQYADKGVAATPDSVRNTSYFNAGLSAYAGNALPEAAAAFKAARINNSNNPQNYIYEIACWQYMAQRDSMMEAPARVAIEEVAIDGYKKFGVSQMLFINNLVNSWVQENRAKEALALVDEQLGQHPDSPALYGLRGFINDRMDNDEASLADYRKAASFKDADFETLKNAAKKILKTGTEMLNKLEGKADKAARQDIKDNYFVAAKDIITRAKGINANDHDVQYLEENIDYALSTYFPN